MDIALVGLGHQGRRYDDVLWPNWVIDTNKGIYGARTSTYKGFSKVETFVKAEVKTDLVVVATPTPTHFYIVKCLLEAGHNVLCEKPLVVKSFEAQELESLAEGANLLLWQTCLERYNPVCRILRKINNEEVDYIVSERCGGKSLEGIELKFDLAIHDVDLWYYFFGAKVDWKFKYGYGCNETRRKITVHLKDQNTIVLDLVKRTVKFIYGSIYAKKDELYSLRYGDSSNLLQEMVNDILWRPPRQRFKWSEEIKFIEENLR